MVYTRILIKYFLPSGNDFKHNVSVQLYTDTLTIIIGILVNSNQFIKGCMIRVY
jgi:hypothetical protein